MENPKTKLVSFVSAVDVPTGTITISTKEVPHTYESPPSFLARQETMYMYYDKGLDEWIRITMPITIGTVNIEPEENEWGKVSL